MIPGERAVKLALLLSVLGVAILYGQVPDAEATDPAALSLDDRGSVARFDGTALDVGDIEGGFRFRLVSGGEVDVVSWGDGTPPGEGDLVSVIGRVDEYRGEVEVVAEEVQVVEAFEERGVSSVEEAYGGGVVAASGTVSRSTVEGCVLEDGTVLTGDAAPGDVVEVTGVVTDPGMPRVEAVSLQVVGVDGSYVHGSVGEVKEAVYGGERGRANLTGVVGGARFDWLLYLYDGSTEGFEARHVNDVLANELPLRFPDDYVGRVPSSLERVRVTGYVEDYRGNPQVEVKSVEPLGTVDPETVKGTVEAVRGRTVVVDGEEFLTAPGLEPEAGDEVSLHALEGYSHDGGRVGVLAE